eukprot:COSAG01_NODE_10427_length_2168_cov_2.747221_3_plen_225_part_00
MPLISINVAQGRYTYFREFSGGLLAGGFEPVCKPIFSEGVPPDFAFSLLDFDWDQFGPLMEEAMLRVPVLETTQLKTLLNGPESFTPDNAYILGEAPQLDGFFVAAGMNSSGIASAAGVGKALAQWIVDGTSSVDLWSVDIRRFGPFHSTVDFLKQRTVETLGLHYSMPWPGRELETGAAAVASFLAAVLTEIYLCNVRSCPEILSRNGRGQGGRCGAPRSTHC